MNPEELQMHGSMFILLQKFVESNFDNATWLKLNEIAKTRQSTYELNKNYPAHEMFSIIGEAANLMKVTENEIKEKFGEYLVPDLLNLYKKYVNPTWKTFEMLENTELIMHKSVRREHNQAHPPILNVSTVHDKLIIIDYYSKRKLACLAVGIIRGIAKYYNESEKVKVVSQSNPNDERVQIRIEFK